MSSDSIFSRLWNSDPVLPLSALAEIAQSKQRSSAAVSSVTSGKISEAASSGGNSPVPPCAVAVDENANSSASPKSPSTSFDAKRQGKRSVVASSAAVEKSGPVVSASVVAAPARQEVGGATANVLPALAAATSAGGTYVAGGTSNVSCPVESDAVKWAKNGGSKKIQIPVPLTKRGEMPVASGDTQQQQQQQSSSIVAPLGPAERQLVLRAAEGMMRNPKVPYAELPLPVGIAHLVSTWLLDPSAAAKIIPKFSSAGFFVGVFCALRRNGGDERQDVLELRRSESSLFVQHANAALGEIESLRDRSQHAVHHPGTKSTQQLTAMCGSTSCLYDCTVLRSHHVLLQRLERVCEILSMTVERLDVGRLQVVVGPSSASSRAVVAAGAGGGAKKGGGAGGPPNPPPIDLPVLCEHYGNGLDDEDHCLVRLRLMLKFPATIEEFAAQYQKEQWAQKRNAIVSLQQQPFAATASPTGASSSQKKSCSVVTNSASNSSVGGGPLTGSEQNSQSGIAQAMADAKKSTSLQLSDDKKAPQQQQLASALPQHQHGGEKKVDQLTAAAGKKSLLVPAPRSSQQAAADSPSSADRGKTSVGFPPPPATPALPVPASQQKVAAAASTSVPLPRGGDSRFSVSTQTQAAPSMVNCGQQYDAYLACLYQRSIAVQTDISGPLILSSGGAATQHAAALEQFVVPQPVVPVVIPAAVVAPAAAASNGDFFAPPLREPSWRDVFGTAAETALAVQPVSNEPPKVLNTVQQTTQAEQPRAVASVPKLPPKVTAAPPAPPTTSASSVAARTAAEPPKVAQPTAEPPKVLSYAAAVRAKASSAQIGGSSVPRQQQQQQQAPVVASTVPSSKGKQAAAAQPPVDSKSKQSAAKAPPAGTKTPPQQVTPAAESEQQRVPAAAALQQSPPVEKASQPSSPPPAASSAHQTSSAVKDLPRGDSVTGIVSNAVSDDFWGAALQQQPVVSGDTMPLNLWQGPSGGGASGWNPLQSSLWGSGVDTGRSARQDVDLWSPPAASGAPTAAAASWPAPTIVNQPAGNSANSSSVQALRRAADRPAPIGIDGPSP